MASSDHSSGRILCVDDHPSFLRMLKAGLKIYGFEVTTASNGMDALTKYKAHSGDIRAVITDNDMPQMNGLELVHSLREIGFKGRIVVISGRLGTQELKTYQQDYGVSAFFHKPFELSTLAKMLHQG